MEEERKKKKRKTPQNYKRPMQMQRFITTLKSVIKKQNKTKEYMLKN